MDRNGRAIYDFRPGQVFAVVWWRRHSEDRQHRTLAIVEALPNIALGRVLPGIHPGVAVHVLVRQHGPAGQDEAVDELLDLIEDLKHRGRNPAELPAVFWTEAARELLICQVPLESIDLEGMVCRPDASRSAKCARQHAPPSRFILPCGAPAADHSSSRTEHHRILVINTSPSVAPGLYLRSSQDPAVGRLVDFCVPLAARPYVRDRTGYGGDDWYILKPIAAGPGDLIDTTGAMAGNQWASSGADAASRR